ncbi:MAG: SRPBCC family protein [Vicingaceae bacterium]
MHQLKRKVTLKQSLEEAWDFFSNPKNLKVITPEYMGFDITSDLDEEMYEGMIITYKVTPLLGIKMDWMSEITHIKNKAFFVDEQRIGPYKLWHHQHHFKEIENGTEMTDIVHYAAPMGFIGKAVEPFLIRPKLKEIFDYREKKMKELDMI